MLDIAKKRKAHFKKNLIPIEIVKTHLSKLYFNKPKLPRTFSACCRSVVYLSMAIYTKKLKSTKDFGKKPRFYP